MKPIYLLIIILVITSCKTYQYKQHQTYESEERKIQVEITPSQSVAIPNDGSAPIAGVKPREKVDKVITFTQVGEKFELKNGQTANFIYDGVSPEETYIIYEQTLDGYILQLAYRDEKVHLPFTRLCQIYIVSNPALATTEVPNNLRYEQIIWTPRADGTWEVRIGTTERGCKSPALDELKNLRTKTYESQVPKR